MLDYYKGSSRPWTNVFHYLHAAMKL